MEQAVVSIPRGIALNRIGLKQRAIERSHGVSFALDTVRRDVVLEGSAQQVRAAEDELRSLLARMNISPDATVVTDVQPQPRPARTGGYYASKPRTGVARYLAAKDAKEYSWMFVATTAAEVIDVDVSEFPYELVRHEYLPPVRSERPQRQQFMQHFDEQFIDAMVRVVNTRAGSSDNVKVEANFGRKLFQLVDVEPNRAYTWNELQTLDRYTAVKSTWSNVCDLEAPAMRSLIVDLQQTAARLGIHEPKEKLSVWISTEPENSRRRCEQFQVKYVRQHGAWTLRKACMYPTPFTDHDVNFINHLSVRTRVYTSGSAPGAKWDASLQALKIQDSDAADSTIFDTTVTLKLDSVDGAETPKIKWSSTKSKLKIPFAGLVFTLTTTKNNDVMLCASLPKKRDNEAVETPGEQFAMLLKQIDALVAQYAVP